MSYGITKTIPKGEGMARLNSLYDGSIAEYEFHMAGNNPKVDVGDYVYTIFNHQLKGRLRIKELIPGHVNPKSGRPRTLIMVECPGERLDPPLPRRGHQGTRYYDGADWPTT
ncbi:MAG: hypothetical protein GY759_07685 [Chloroflexi bacterium]|nr:hypothetical protein [Chloroflexota bacterium]